jgi:DNA mismatch repair protein MutL
VSRIHILPDNLANLIAAGEVVERPASALKELVENSIDAGARRIEVRLREGGKELLQVTDDGCGMTAEDLVLAVHRFATSKINEAEDLESIETLGFRGEALPSIGAVSRLKIVTRPADAPAGTVITVDGGEITALEEIGSAPGTTVAMADLFYNTPARRKFLATTATERGHCQEWVTRLALAYPEVSLRLLHNDAQLLATSGSGDLGEAIAACLGSDLARELVAVDLEVGGLRVQGYVSSPRVLRANRAQQFFYVNRRYVRSRSLAAALAHAYGMLLPAGRQPLCVLHVTIEADQVDPNVHPTKIEVRFKRPGESFSLMERAVSEALAREGYRSLDQRYNSAGAAPGGLLPAGRIEPPDFDRRGEIQRLRVNPFFAEVDERDVGLELYGEEPEGAPRETPATAPVPGHLQLLGQLWNRYLVAHSAERLVLVDQHRAAERVLFDRLLQQAERGPAQLLALPQTLELTGPEFSGLTESREALEQLGYQLEEFGGSSFLVRAVPAAAAYRDPLMTLRELAADLAESELPAQWHLAREELLARVACHAAITAGERLTPAEMQNLLRDLLATQTPAVCPHGDPIIIDFPQNQVDRRFHR